MESATAARGATGSPAAADLAPLAPGRRDLAELRDPLFALYAAYVATLPITRPAVAHVGAQPVMVADLLVVALYAVWGLRLVRGRVSVAVDRLLLASLAYLVVLAVTLVAVPPFRIAGVVKLVAYATLVLLPVLTVRIVDRPARMRLVLAAWAAGAALTVAIGIVGLLAFYLGPKSLDQLLGCGYGNLKAGPYPRLCAPFRHPNMFQNYLNIAVPLGLAMAWGRVRAVWLAVALVVTGIVSVFTLSTAFAGLLGGVLIVLMRVWRGPSGLRAVTLAGLGAATGGAALLLTLATIAGPVPSGQGHIPIGSRDLRLMDESRPSIWRGALRTFLDHPIIGYGYGTEVSVVTDPRAFVPKDKQPFVTYPVKPHRMEAHNVWLSVAGQAGIIGLGAFLFLLSCLWRPAWRLLRSPDEGWRRLGTGLAAAFVGAFLYHGLFAAIEEARHEWALFALAAAAGALATRARPATR